MPDSLGKYREFEAPARLAAYVECFWQQSAVERIEQPVLPDGCADILFTSSAGVGERLEIVGPMTRRITASVSAGDFLFGVRFRPGMAHCFLPLPGTLLTDRIVNLESVLGRTGRTLLEKLANARTVGDRTAAFESLLTGEPQVSPVQKVIAWAAAGQGVLSVNDAAGKCGYSSRQFRRRCLEETGLSPKQMLRTIRFRNALSLIQTQPPRDWAGLALECGYYDQSHLINEFREFTGSPPGSLIISTERYE